MRGNRGESCVAGRDTLAAIYEFRYGKASMYMAACKEVIGLPGDVFVGGEDSGGRVAQ